MNVDIKFLVTVGMLVLGGGIAWGQTQNQIEQIEKGVVENSEVFKQIEAMQRELMVLKFDQQRDRELLEQKLDLLLERMQ